MKGIVGVIIVLGVSSVGEAQLFRRACRVCRPAVKVVKQVVVEQQVVAPVGFVLLPQQPVSYGAPSYQAPREQTQTSRVETLLVTRLEELGATLQSLDARLRALETQSDGSNGTSVQVPQIISQQCGKCHGEESYQNDGGGISFADMSGEKNDAALSAVGIRRTMPKLAGEGESIPEDLRRELVAALQEMRR